MFDDDDDDDDNDDDDDDDDDDDELDYLYSAIKCHCVSRALYNVLDIERAKKKYLQFLFNPLTAAS